jgi:nucleoside-diphosphate-sugar epimerase
MRHVFVTGGTGFIGRPLIEELLRRGHRVTALIRPGSESRLAPGCDVVLGNALESSYAPTVCGADSFVHLVGVANPLPWKIGAFREIDLASIRAAVECATLARISHFVYLSVAQPALAMRAYAAARRQGEDLIRKAGLNATILRPWYVTGPGRHWPVVLNPLFFAGRAVPLTRGAATRRALTTVNQITLAVVRAVEHPSAGVSILDANSIRAASLQ